jgi:hypothetical protein
MVVQSSLKVVDLEKLVDGVAKLELRALHAGIECVQVWIAQAAKLSTIASDTLQAAQDKKASLSDTARRLTEFGRQNADVFGSLSTRLNATYYDELERLTDALATRKSRAVDGAKAVERRSRTNPAPAKARARARRGASAKA